MRDTRVSDEIILRVSRLVNEIEDIRQQANDDLKTTWGDAREELRGLGLTGKEISEQVGYLKAAIAESRLSKTDLEKREAKVEGRDEYLAILTTARARAHVRAA